MVETNPVARVTIEIAQTATQVDHASIVDSPMPRGTVLHMVKNARSVAKTTTLRQHVKVEPLINVIQATQTQERQG